MLSQIAFLNIFYLKKYYKKRKNLDMLYITKYAKNMETYLKSAEKIF